MSTNTPNIGLVKPQDTDIIDYQTIFNANADKIDEQIGSLLKRNKAVSVTEAPYNADSTGTTDSTSIIQSMLNTDGIRSVIIPEDGTFLVSDIIVPDGKRVVGEGTLKANGTVTSVLMLGSSGRVKGIKFDMNNLVKQAIKSDGKDNVKVDDIDIINQGASATIGTSISAIRLMNGKNARVTNVDANTVSSVVGLDYMKDVIVSRIDMKKLSAVGVLVFGGCERVTVSQIIVNNDGYDPGNWSRPVQWWGGNASDQANKDVFDLTNQSHPGVYDVTVSDVICRNVRAAVWGSKGKRIAVSNCQAHTVDDVAYDVEGCYDVTFNNCHATNSNNGGIATFYGGGNITFNACKTIIESDFLGSLWLSSTTYNVGDIVHNGSLGSVYKCTVAGTSGITIPSHTTGTATDGTVTWQFIKVAQMSAFAGGSTWDRVGTNGVKVTGCEFINKSSALAKTRHDRGPINVTFENCKFKNTYIGALDQNYKYRINNNEFEFNITGNYNAILMKAYSDFEIKHNRIKRSGAESTPTVTDAAIYGTKNNNSVRYSTFTMIQNNTIEGFTYSITTDQTSDVDGGYGQTSVLDNKVSGQITRDLTKPNATAFTRENYIDRNNYDQHGITAKTAVTV